MHQDFQQSDDAIVFKPDAGHPPALKATGRGQLFQEWVVHFHVQVLGLRVGKSIIDRLELFGHLGQVLQSPLLAEVLEVVRARLDPQERAVLLVLLDECIL